jgi:hypothetical protein
MTKMFSITAVDGLLMVSAVYAQSGGAGPSQSSVRLQSAERDSSGWHLSAHVQHECPHAHDPGQRPELERSFRHCGTDD